MRALLVVLALSLSACATVREAQQIPEPESLIEALAIAQGQIMAVRDVTAFTLRAKGEDCVANRFTDLCSAARKVDETTYTMRGRIDQIKDAYGVVLAGTSQTCTITYEGQTFPCEDEVDRILAGLIELRKMIGGVQ